MDPRSPTQNIPRRSWQEPPVHAAPPQPVPPPPPPAHQAPCHGNPRASTLPATQSMGPRNIRQAEQDPPQSTPVSSAFWTPSVQVGTGKGWRELRCRPIGTPGGGDTAPHPTPPPPSRLTGPNDPEEGAGLPCRQRPGGHRGRFRTARAQRAHSANYYGDYPGNNPENHPPAESCTINSKLKNPNI